MDFLLDENKGKKENVVFISLNNENVKDDDLYGM